MRYSEECARGVGKGIELCVGALVPSLFLFMALSAYTIESGCGGYFNRAFGWLAGIMGLPKEAASAIVMAMIGGYPIGAVCCGLLYENGQLSESEARKTAYIAVSAGPGFVINYVGRSLIGNIGIGNILLASQITAVIFSGIVIGRIVKCSPPKIRAIVNDKGSGALASAVNSAAQSTMRMCAMVVLFSGLTEAVTSLADESIADIAAAALEVTTACGRLCGDVHPAVAAFIIGFGGLSVHFQIFANLRNIEINKCLFILFRAAQGIIAAGATYIYLMMIPMETAAFSSTLCSPAPAASATLFGSAALAAASVCFVGSMASRIRRSDHVRNSRLAG